MGYTRPVDKLTFEEAWAITVQSDEVEIDTGLPSQRFELWDVRTSVTTFGTAVKIDTRVGVSQGFTAHSKDQRYANTDNTLATPTSYANGPSSLRQEIQSDTDGKIYVRLDLDIVGTASGFVRVVLAPGG